MIRFSAFATDFDFDCVSVSNHVCAAYLDLDYRICFICLLPHLLSYTRLVVLISGSYDSCNIFPSFAASFSFFLILSDITFGCELAVLVALILRIHGRAITTTVAAVFLPPTETKS